MRALDSNGVQLTRGMKVLAPDGRTGLIVAIVQGAGVLVKWDGETDDEMADPVSLIATETMHVQRRRRSH